jgi:hypothetical protein
VNAAMTLDRYGHLEDGDLDLLARRLSAARDRVVPQLCPTATISTITEREVAV